MLRFQARAAMPGPSFLLSHFKLPTRERKERPPWTWTAGPWGYCKAYHLRGRHTQTLSPDRLDVVAAGTDGCDNVPRKHHLSAGSLSDSAVSAPWTFGFLAVICNCWWLFEAITGSCIFCSQTHLAVCKPLIVRAPCSSRQEGREYRGLNSQAAD